MFPQQKTGSRHAGAHLKWRLALAATAVLALLPGRTTLAADYVPLPFPEGTAVRVIQGYNGGTHQGASHYGLDLVLANGGTSGATVVSPLDGTVAWAFEPGDRTGCIQVTAADGRFATMLCHVLLDRPFARGERVARGQPLGTVGAAGTLGNNGAPHVHMELHAGGRGSSPVPFGAPEGLPLEWLDLPASGAANEHVGVAVLVSSNTLSDAPPQPTPAPRATPARPASGPAAPGAAGTRCLAGDAPRYVFGFADLKAYLGDAMGDPLTCEFADPNGTGDVHQQTSRGLAFWRKSTNTPTFTDGWDHWGRTEAGWVAWTGDSIDPPGTAPQPTATPAPASPTATSTPSPTATARPTQRPSTATPSPSPTRRAPTATPTPTPRRG